MLDLNKLDQATVNTKSKTDRKPADGWANLYIGLATKAGKVKYKQLGEYGIALDAENQLHAMLMELAQEDPEAITEIDLQLRVVAVDNTEENEFEGFAKR